MIKISFSEPTEVQLKKPFTLEPVGRITARRIMVRPEQNGLVLNGITHKIFGLVLEPQNKSDFRLNNKPFRGRICIAKNNQAKLTLMRLMGLEEYVLGVIANEVYSDWPPETLKAQAAASRTFALYKMQENLYDDFDLSSTIQDQRFAPPEKVRDSFKKAVEDTRGTVLLYRGKIFPAFFHSTCGGHTGNAAHYWALEDIPPLKGITCNKCRGSPHYYWSKKVPLNAFREKLAQSGIKLGRIFSAQVESTAQGNEAIFNRRLRISAYRLRTFLGDVYLRSPEFGLKIRGKNMYIEGKGFGHGIGLCQWGAKKLAKEGKTFQEILQFYYPESEIGILAER